MLMINRANHHCQQVRGTIGAMHDNVHNFVLILIIMIAYLQVLTRGAKVLYESCVDTVQYEQFFKGEFIALKLSHFVLYLREYCIANKTNDLENLPSRIFHSVS